MEHLAKSEYRWIPVLFVVLPLSYVWSLYDSLRRMFKTIGACNHTSKINNISEQVKKKSCTMNSEVGKPSKEFMCTARPGYQSMSLFEGAYKKYMSGIDLSTLDDILHISEDYVHLEPMVTCNQLITQLTSRGLSLPVVPELGDLTVGGLIMGFGIETSSFKYGLFHETCLEYEILLSSGDVIICTPNNEYADLFHAIPWSHGTLGFLLSVKVRIINAKRYCKLHYTPFFSRQPLLEALEQASRCHQNDFVECIMYTKDAGVLLTGVMTDDCEGWAAWYNVHYSEAWFYTRVEDVLKKGHACHEYWTLENYYKRHQKSLFWEMQDLLPFGNHWLFRWSLGWMMPPKVSLLKASTPASLHEVQKRHHIIEDYLIPMSELTRLLLWLDVDIAFYPLWLCPYRTPGKQFGFTNVMHHGEQFYVDVGVYGVPECAKRGNFYHEAFHQRAEALLREMGGYKGLYAQTHQSKEDFERMFNHSLYKKMKLKYDSVNRLPEVYDKVCRYNRV